LAFTVRFLPCTTRCMCEDDDSLILFLRSRLDPGRKLATYLFPASSKQSSQ
jgi:hypothetical protein